MKKYSTAIIFMAFSFIIDMTNNNRAYAANRFIVSNFNFNSDPGTGNIFSVSNDGSNVEQIIGGLDGLQLLTQGPGGKFGNDIYVTSEGLTPLDADNDGAVFRLNEKNELTPFITNIDASQVAFDTQGVLGGGMFVTDWEGTFTGTGPEQIWQVTPKSSSTPTSPSYPITPILSDPSNFEI